MKQGLKLSVITRVVCTLLFSLILLLVIAKPSSSQSFPNLHTFPNPDSVGAQVTYEVIGDTTTFTFHIDSLVNFFWLSEFSNDPVELIWFVIDGDTVQPDIQTIFGDVYDTLITIRFGWEQPFNDVQVQYYCSPTSNKMQWVAGTPLFGFTGIIGDPEHLNFFNAR